MLLLYILLEWAKHLVLESGLLEDHVILSAPHLMDYDFKNFGKSKLQFLTHQIQFVMLKKWS